MLSSLLRPKKQRRRVDKSSYFQDPIPPISDRHNHPQDVLEAQSSLVDEESSNVIVDLEDEASGEDTPLLPIFLTAHLDALPVFDLVHSIRLLILQRCETTLSWEQLRSPQVSQFLVKPIQQQILAVHFSKATLYALLANELNFGKEANTNPGNVGVNKTRALLSELLAMRLLKEFSTRELIDALSYDFDPLSGMNSPTGELRRSDNRENQTRPSTSRTSTLEVAIKAQAKRFLAHPMVVQHLEAIWDGTVVFHSAADNLHRYPSAPIISNARHYGATHEASSEFSRGRSLQRRASREKIRRSVTLYNPSDASLFKLSRLRVPRYRQHFSTVSFGIMLGLFLAILIERSEYITTLEVIFWFWSAGFMLDEIVGFSEQGFGLYLMSVWNAFDIGILLLFFIYYVLRLYGILVADEERHHMSNLAYDVLASTAVLLFPRLFSLLDHYRYFSVLIVAMKMMAFDLVAIMLIILVASSGFFIAFSLSFSDEGFKGADIAYRLFQILMGFTPAAWDIWSDYNILGKFLLTLFLIVCHFVVVTVLITVLTNSFMTIVKNANEEHQFLFAVNVLSAVKSDALFSYIAPSNILGWLIGLSPLRLCSLRYYVVVNRTVIKFTHFPILFIIFIYERLALKRYAIEKDDFVEKRARWHSILPVLAADNAQVPGPRLREPSIATYRKDQALEEVFRRPFNADTLSLRPAQSTERHTNVIDSWINGMGAPPSPPLEQPRSVLDQLEGSRSRLQRSIGSGFLHQRQRRSGVSRSIKSDPADIMSTQGRPALGITGSGNLRSISHQSVQQSTDADADDEQATEPDNPRTVSADKENTPSPAVRQDSQPIFPSSSHAAAMPSPEALGGQDQTPNMVEVRGHLRNSSTKTIVFKPVERRFSKSPVSPPKRSTPGPTPPNPPWNFVEAQKRQVQRVDARPSMPQRNLNLSAPNTAGYFELASRNFPRNRRRLPSFDTLALDLASDIGDQRERPYEPRYRPPAAQRSQNRFSHLSENIGEADSRRSSDEDAVLLNRLVLARVNVLEEGFKDMLKEFREWKASANAQYGSLLSSSVEDGGEQPRRRRAGTVRRRSLFLGPQHEARGVTREVLAENITPEVIDLASRPSSVESDGNKASESATKG